MTDGVARAVPRIVSLTALAMRRSLPRPWGAEAPENTVVAVTVNREDGRAGAGFAWTPTVGAGALVSLIEHDVASAVVGMPAHPALVSERLFAALHEGGAGLVQVAAASVDLALWDLEATDAGRSVVDHLGRRRDEVRAYGSGVNLHYTLDELVAQVERWVSAGFDAVKVKVGKPDLGEDLDRLDAVRSVLGPHRALMVDANQRWDGYSAQRAAKAMARFDIAWLEEPLRADDVAAHARLRGRIDVPIALGENAHSVYRFRELIESGACDVIQPNAIRVGGITPFRRIVEIAESASVPVFPHLLPDLSAQLALTLPRDGWVEDVEDAGLAALGVLSEPSPVFIQDGVATVSRQLGLGLHFVAPEGEDS